MARNRIRLPRSDGRCEVGFGAIRTELGVPDAYPERALTEASAAARRGPVGPPESSSDRADRRQLALITIDPAGSRDLDQAYGAERHGTGYRVWYAIADVAAFVTPGGALDSETQARGVTMYSPDVRTPLHPAVISEGQASLLPNRDRAALLWRIDLDDRGTLADAHVERATVRSRELLSYALAQQRIDSGHHEALQLLGEIGQLRLERERARGAVSLRLPDQQVVADENGSYRLEYGETLPVERWNAQISLLTGIAAAEIMIDAGIGLLRTLPEPDADTIVELRLTARGLGIEWPRYRSYADVLRGLDPNEPRQAALIAQGLRTLRGAGYSAFDGAAPSRRRHSAIAAPYAHVTAPLRRLCDRYASEIVLAACGRSEVPGWARARLGALPAVMNEAARRDRALDRAIVDFMEALVLEGRTGERFPAVVTNVGAGRSRLQLRHPAVIATLADDQIELGSRVRVRLVAADPTRRTVQFELVP